MFGPSEGIAQISEETIGRTRPVGRNAEGLPILEKLPEKRSRLMINTAGVEVFVPICNHRLFTEDSYRQYGRLHEERQVAAGFLPKDECPLTRKYAHVVGGSGRLMEPEGKEEECRLSPQQTQAPDWDGCKHYQRAKELRREKAAKKAQAGNTKEPSPEIIELAKAMKQISTQPVEPEE